VNIGTSIDNFRLGDVFRM